MKSKIVKTMASYILITALIGLGTMTVYACYTDIANDCPNTVKDKAGDPCSVDMGYHSGTYNTVDSGNDFKDTKQSGNCCQYDCPDNTKPTFYPATYGLNDCT